MAATCPRVKDLWLDACRQCSTGLALWVRCNVYRLECSLQPKADSRKCVHGFKHRTRESEDGFLVKDTSRPIVRASQDPLHPALGATSNQSLRRPCGLQQSHSHGCCVNKGENLQNDHVRCGPIPTIKWSKGVAGISYLIFSHGASAHLSQPSICHLWTAASIVAVRWAIACCPRLPANDRIRLDTSIAGLNAVPTIG